MRISRWLVLAAVLAMAAALEAEVWNDPGGVTSTSTSATINFPHPMSSVLVVNDDLTVEVFVRLFGCDETPVDATTSSIGVKPSEGRTYPHDTRTQGGIGWCFLTHITASGTAALRVEAQ